MLARSVEPVLLDRLDPAVESDPRHDFREGELARRAANLPDALVRLLPDRLQIFEQLLLQRPGKAAAFEPVAVTGVERVHQLAINVELQLFVRGIADPHRSAVAIT